VEIDRLRGELSEARVELAALRMDQSDPCTVCAGKGTPISGDPCICGGTGRGADEKAGLRHKLAALRRQVEQDPVRRALAQGGNIFGGNPIAVCFHDADIWTHDDDLDAACEAALKALEKERAYEADVRADWDALHYPVEADPRPVRDGGDCICHETTHGKACPVHGWQGDVKP